MKVYKLHEVSIDMEKNIAIVSENGFILQGKVYKVGNKDEKRYNDEIVNFSLPFTCGSYILWTVKGNNLLKEAVKTIELLEGNVLTARGIDANEKKLIEILNITEHHNTETSASKLDGINSLSTSCLDNNDCINRMKCGEAVCKYCYSKNQQLRQLSLQDRNIVNGIILKNYLFSEKSWKKHFDRRKLTKFFRIESFGDTENAIQGKNYIHFIKAFPKIYYSLFSKALLLYASIFRTEEKPKNLSYVHSSLRLNCAEIALVKRFSFVDHLFTVYDKKYIELNNIKITCGGKACLKDCCKKKKGCFFPKTDIKADPILESEEKK